MRIMSCLPLNTRVFIFVLVFNMLLSGCNSAPSTPESSRTSPPPPLVEIEILNMDPRLQEISAESVPQNNCGGNAEVENSYNRSRSISRVITASAGFEVRADGSIGISGTTVALGSSVASSLGVEYGATENISRSITVKASPKSHMNHRISLQEVWYDGSAQIKINDETIRVPFSFRSDFAIALLNSEEIPCPSTHTPTAVSPMPSPTVPPTPSLTPSQTPTATEPSPTVETAVPATPTRPPEILTSTLFELDISQYEVGDLPTGLGTDLIIQDSAGKRYIAGYNERGRMEISNLRFEGSFELFLELHTDYGARGSLQLGSVSGPEDDITMNWRENAILFGEQSLHVLGYGNTNEIRLSVSDGVAKVFVNSHFIRSAPVRLDMAYNTLVINGLRPSDGVYALEVSSIPPRSEIPTETIVVIQENPPSFYVDLEPYQVGDLPTALGTNLIVHNNGGKHIAGYNNTGRLEINRIELTGNFEITVDLHTYYGADGSLQLKASNDSGYDISLGWRENAIIFGDQRHHILGYGNTNEIILSASGEIVKLFVNSVFIHSIPARSETAYNTLIINGLRPSDAIYRLRGAIRSR
jgi:hypothetical protein